MVDSAPKCNTLIEADLEIGAKFLHEGFDRCFEAEALSWCEIESHGDFLNILPSQVFEVGAARQPSSYSSIGIFDATLLPAGIGIAEPGGHAGDAGEEAMTGKLAAVVEK